MASEFSWEANLSGFVLEGRTPVPVNLLCFTSVYHILTISFCNKSYSISHCPIQIQSCDDSITLHSLFYSKDYKWSRILQFGMSNYQSCKIAHKMHDFTCECALYNANTLYVHVKLTFCSALSRANVHYIMQIAACKIDVL